MPRNKNSIKERIIELLSDGERRSVGDIGTYLGIYKHNWIETVLMNNQHLFDYDGHGWKGRPQRDRARVDPIMQGGLDL